MYNCAVCGNNFVHRQRFLNHLKSHPDYEFDAETLQQKNANTDLNKCKFCPLSFQSKSDYLSHIEDTHQHNSKNAFMCSECGKLYKTKTELTHHINSKCGTIRQFKCKVCGQELMSAGSLYNHMLRHKGERSFMCRFCAKLFFTMGQLKVHERIHLHDKAYVCEVCNKGFCHRQSLITHSTLHTGIKPYQCENCGNSFSCVGNLIKHRRTHSDTCGLIPLTTHRIKHPATKIKVRINTPDNSRLKTRLKKQELQKELDNLKTDLFKDDNKTEPEEKPEPSHEPTIANCDETSRNLIKFEEVLIEEPSYSSSYEDEATPQVVHEETSGRVSDETAETKTVKKKKCSRKNPNFNMELAEYKAQIDFESTGRGVCKYCGKGYWNLPWLLKHIKDHEVNMPNSLDAKVPMQKCCCCKSSFYTKDECLAHQQAVHADILSCQECEKIFANRDSLRAHQKVFHKGIGRKAYLYICEKCGMQFKQKSYLICHEQRQCDKGPFYQCSICKKNFVSKHTRNNHMRIHSSEKKLLCKFCAKSFHWQGQLKIHERSHTGEKPFACLYCPKAFAYRESLITHSTIHTGMKPHLCEGCGSRFSCIGNLIKHRSSHASECGAWKYTTNASQKNC